jgi:hypothetical protein
VPEAPEVIGETDVASVFVLGLFTNLFTILPTQSIVLLKRKDNSRSQIYSGQLS